MDLTRIIKILFLIIFNENILLTICQPSNSLQYFTVTYPPINPLVQWLNRRPTRKPFPNNRNMCKPCKCGLTNGGQKIVGGNETGVNQYPWMAMLVYNNIFYCGGSLINDHYILTAAHCIRGFSARKIVVKLLAHQRGLKNPEEIERKVKYGLVYNKFNSFTFENDIGLLLLEQAVPINDIIRPICLPDYITDTESFVGEKGTVIGWGALSEQGPLSATLQEVEVPILNKTECASKIPISNNMFCAGLPEGQKDSCQGDSGGPLMISNENKYTQIGIVSWGDGCGRPDKPGVYTEVANFRNWIEKNTRDSCYC